MDFSLKDRARALRRHHRARLKDARRHYWGRGTFDWDARQLSMVTRTPQMCSDWCCGNARKWFGVLPVQERRATQESVEQLLAESSVYDDAPVEPAPDAQHLDPA